MDRNEEFLSEKDDTSHYLDFENYNQELLAGFELELELELIQSHMAQKPMLRGEVGARALCVRSVSKEEA